MELGEREVLVMPITKTLTKKEIGKKLNVTFYARVSTDSDEQEESYERQKEVFEKTIKARSDWNYVEGYADQGLTGTDSDRRVEFQRMIKDCQAGKIDKILVKSVARFARNVVDTLSYIRLLKDLGISVYFELQNIDTLTPNGEILITILAALAEQESRTMSHNIKWAYQKRFKEGQVLINSMMLGYKKEGKNYVIDEEEANIVRLIFRRYVAGYTARQIAEEINNLGVTTRQGNLFYASNILNILGNEKYTGNAYLGKTFKPDVLSKKRIKNEGQAVMYYVKNSHPAIITQELFEMAQMQRKVRNELRSSFSTGKGRYSSKYPFSGLLVCGKCGSKFRRYGRRLANGYVYTWLCVEHQKDKTHCDMLPIKEEDIYKAYGNAIETLCGDLSDVVEQVKKVIEEELKSENFEDLKPIEKELQDSRNNMMQLFKDKNAKKISEQEYAQKYEMLSNRITELDGRLKEMTNDNVAKQIHKEKLNDVLKVLTDEGSDYYDPQVIRTLLETIVVKDKNTLEFQLRCGLNITEKI